MRKPIRDLVSHSVFLTLLSAAVFAMSAAHAIAGDVIVNGSFQTGDFTGWTTNPVSYPEYIVTSPVANGDTYSAQIAGYLNAADTLSQLVTDQAGESYDLSFAYYIQNGQPNGLTVTWDGTTIFSVTNGPDSTDFETVSADVVGTGSDNLVFSAYNTPGWIYLDNVSAVPAGVPDGGSLLLVTVGVFGGLLLWPRRGSRTL